MKRTVFFENVNAMKDRERLWKCSRLTMARDVAGKCGTSPDQCSRVQPAAAALVDWRWSAGLPTVAAGVLGSVVLPLPFPCEVPLLTGKCILCLFFHPVHGELCEGSLFIFFAHFPAPKTVFLSNY